MPHTFEWPGDGEIRRVFDRSDAFLRRRAEYAKAVGTRKALLQAIAVLENNPAQLTIQEREQTIATLYCLLAQRGCEEATGTPHRPYLTDLCDIAMYG